MIFIEHGEINQGVISVVTLKGQLDSATAADFEAFIVQLLEKERRYIIIGMEQLEYCSSAGIGLILYLQKKVSAGGGMLVLQGLSSELKTLFTILGFDRLVSLAEGADDARGILEKHIQFTDRPAPGAGSGSGTEHGKPEPVEVFEVVGDGEEPSYEPRGRGAGGGSPAAEVPPRAPARAESAEFEVPLIVECAECKSLTRVRRSGSFICPECHTEFTVEKDQTIIF
jgi:anti-anti-sigma factor